MPLIDITGIAGSGKTTVQKELKRRGYDAHDVDDPEIGGAYNNKTNERVKIPDISERTPDWWAAHSWRIHSGIIEELKIMSADKLIFLCGRASNDLEKAHLFDKLICLDIDDETIRHRLTTRQNDNDYGKSEHELNQILERHQAFVRNCKKHGAKMVDATQPIDQVIEDIVKITGNLKN